MSNTILFGGSGFFGPIILEQYPDIISVGRTNLPIHLKNEHIHIDNLDDLHVLDNIDINKVIFLIGNSNHHKINMSSAMGLEYNVLPLKKILHYLKDKDIQKFIAFSSPLLYDEKRIQLPIDESQQLNPYKNSYIFSKWMAEENTKCYPEVPTINVRLANIYGPTRLIRPDLVPTLIQNALSPNEVEVWSIKPERDFLYTRDAAEAIVSLLDTDYVGPLNMGSGTMSSVGKIVEIVEDLSGKKVNVLDIPVSGPMKFRYDISLLKKLTGWQPRHSLEEGLTKTYNEMKTYANECRWWEQKQD